jgi:hypothetical protein
LLHVQRQVLRVQRHCCMCNGKCCVCNGIAACAMASAAAASCISRHGKRHLQPHLQLGTTCVDIHRWCMCAAACSRGPRDCIGQRFAYLEAKTILAMVLARFSFRYAREGWQEEVALSITNRPKFGVPMTVVRRQQ